MALKLSGSISLTGSLATDSNIVATVVTSSFFTGSYLDSLGNTGSADEILVSDGRGGGIYSVTSQVTGDSRIAASANDFSVSWEGGLNFTASAGKVFMPGENAPRSQQGVKGITLSAGDSTHPRFDVFVFSASAADTTSGSVEVIEGTPSENPVYPDIDFSSEVPLKFVLLKANATVVSDGSDETNTDTSDFSTSNIYSNNVSGSGGWYSFGRPERNANLTGSNTYLYGSFTPYIGSHKTSSYGGFNYSSSFNEEVTISQYSGDFNSFLYNPMAFVHPDWETGNGLTLGSLDNFSFDIKFPGAITGSDYRTSQARTSIENSSYIRVEFHSVYLSGNRYRSSWKGSAIRYFKTDKQLNINSGAFQKFSIPSSKISKIGFAKDEDKINFISIRFYKRNTYITNLFPGDDKLLIKNINWDDGSGTTPEIDQTGNSISQASQTKPTVVSGKQNTLATTAVSSVVVSGENNRVTTKRSFIGAGRNNLITGNTDSVIGGGSFNSSSNSCTFIGGGSNNILTGSAVSSSIVGGFNNSSSLANTHIIGSNITADKANYTYVNNLDVAGTVSGSTFSGSFVGDGSGLTGISGGGSTSFPFTPYISGSTSTAIIPIASDAATSIGAYSTIAGGRHNEIRTTSPNSFIGSGCQNCITHFMSFIGAGCKNTGSSGCSFIGAGRNNFNQGSSAGIVAGWENKICNLAYYGFIGSGQCNTLVGGTQHAAIVGGCNNVLNDNTDGGIIGAGKSNTISNGACCSGILGGVSNTVDHDKAFIIGSNLTTTAQCYTFVNNLCNVGGGTSDCRLKENIVNIPYGLTHISQLNPVSFNFKDDESKKIKYGFLAQCVQEVMPDLVYHHPTDLVDGDPVLQFDREAIWASTINAIKDLKQQVEVLKAEIEILKQQ